MHGFGELSPLYDQGQSVYFSGTTSDLIFRKISKKIKESLRGGGLISSYHRDALIEIA